MAHLSALLPRAILATVLLAICGGCTVRLISEYDETIDQEATRLQKALDSFLTGLETGAGTEDVKYGEVKDFYDRYAVDVRSLHVRAQAHPKNEISVKQYGLILDSLEQLESAHRGPPENEDDGEIPPAAISVFRDLFNQAWGAIIKLEVAKKR